MQKKPAALARSVAYYDTRPGNEVGLFFDAYGSYLHNKDVD